MILPQKHIKLSESLFGFGGVIMDLLGSKTKNLDALWNEFEKINNTDMFPTYQSFDNFLLALDYLFLIGAINQDDKGGLYCEIN